ncbi:hypothetical protein KCP75_01680 [Salmonella enterica subsp. enterica]|nr:hypothetical protein KCP75_01680 [Salmonella enterica subsp. enterica]
MKSIRGGDRAGQQRCRGAIWIFQETQITEVTRVRAAGKSRSDGGDNASKLRQFSGRVAGR